MPIHAHKMEFLGDVVAGKHGAVLMTYPKGTPLGYSVSFEPSHIKIGLGVWLLKALAKKVEINKHNFRYTVFHPFSQKPSLTSTVAVSTGLVL